MSNFHPRTGTEASAYDAGRQAGYSYTGSSIDSSCPFDGRTRMGKAWWAGYMVDGDRARCEEARMFRAMGRNKGAAS